MVVQNLTALSFIQLEPSLYHQHIVISVEWGRRKEGSPLCKNILLSCSSLMLEVWCLAGNDTDMCDNKVTRGRIACKVLRLVQDDWLSAGR